MTQYKQCSKDTSAHWIKETLKLAGINSGIYLGHNLRAASTFQPQPKGSASPQLLNQQIGQRNPLLRNTTKKK